MPGRLCSLSLMSANAISSETHRFKLEKWDRRSMRKQSVVYFAAPLTMLLRCSFIIILAVGAKCLVFETRRSTMMYGVLVL